MPSDEEAREARRRARAAADGFVSREGVHPPVDVSRLSPDERLSLVMDLTLAAWKLAGKELPRIPRAQWPGRVIRSA